MAVLTIRKLADKTREQRVVKYDPETGIKKLVNPATPGDDHEPWPFAGVAIEGEPPQSCVVPTSFVADGIAQGWIRGNNEQVVTRPGGPADDRWRVIHTFRHFDSIVIDTVNGLVQYTVVHQPDKYATDGDDDTPVTDQVYADGATRVDWFYGLELVGTMVDKLPEKKGRRSRG